MTKIPIRSLSPETKESISSGSFTIRDVKDILKGRDIVHELHRHTFFFILAIKIGAGTHDIDFVTYPVADNTIFLLRPGQVHQLELNAGSKGYLIEFDPEFYHPSDDISSRRLRKATSKTHCVLDDTRFNRLFSTLAYMFNEFSEKEVGYMDAIKANLDIFFIEYVRQSQPATGSSRTENSYTQGKYEEFLELVEKNIANIKQVSQYADLMNLSTYQLNSITKAIVGKAALEVLTEHILLEAKRYLLATSNQIKQIADTLGYEDISYFIRFFKKHTGYTPESFRQNFK